MTTTPDLPPTDKPQHRTLLYVVLGLAAILILAYLFVGNLTGDDNQDRLGDEASITHTATSPEDRCGAQAVHDRIKQELFRRAARVRGSDAETFDQLANISSVRMEATIVTGEDEQSDTVECQGTMWIDLPPGVVTRSRRTSISTEISYSVQSSQGGSPPVVRIGNGEGIVSPLATIVRLREPSSEPIPPANPQEDPLAPMPEPQQPQQPAPAPVQPEPRPSAQPSYDCGNARSPSEIAVCNDSGLASLDRQMASQFNQAMSAGDQGDRRLLVQTRDRFLSYRDRCRTNDCIADVYRGRMREIRDIMNGQWQPPR